LIGQYITGLGSLGKAGLGPDKTRLEGPNKVGLGGQYRSRLGGPV